MARTEADLPGGDGPASDLAAVTGAVRPRGLVPTTREEAQGRGRDGAGRADDGAMPVLPPEGEGGTHQTPKQKLIQYVKNADPRGIEGPKLPLVIFGLLSMVTTWDDAVIGVVLPLIQTAFTFDLTIILAARSFGQFLSFVMGPVIGHLVDRHSRVYFVRAAAIISNLSSILLGFVSSSLGFAGVLMLRTTGNVVVGPAQYTLQADYYPTRWRVRVFGFTVMAFALGNIVGPTVAGSVADALGWRMALWILGGLSLAVGSLTFLLKEPVRGYWERKESGATDAAATKEQAPLDARLALRTLANIATLRRLWIATVFTFLPLIGAVIFRTLMFAAEFGLGPRQLGYVLSAGGVVAFFSVFFAGPAVDRLVVHKPGKLLVAYGGLIAVAALSIVATAVAPTLPLALVASLPSFIVATAAIPLMVAIISLVVPARVRGLGMQSFEPFQIGSLAVVFAGRAISTGLFGDLLGPTRAGLLGLAIPLFIGAALLATGAPFVERDMRSAKASAMADEEAEQARARGRSKMIICRDVDVTYDGVQVLFGVDFDVEEGELVALLGTNGAGKSTLLRAICGIQPASNGAIFLDGVDITRELPHQNAARGIVMVPGGHAVFPTLTVEENLRTAGWLYRGDDDYPLEEKIEEVLGFFPILRERFGEVAGNMSGGEQQMLAVSQAFLMKPRLLMIDELSLGLAPQVVQLLLDTLRRLHASGTTIVIVEQSINVAMTIADRAVFMEKGEVRFDGPATELLRRPELVRAVFMGGAVGGKVVARPASAKVGDDPQERLVSVKDAQVSFGGVTALQGATLEVLPGEIVGIIGPNGAGKTTLFDVISGFVRPGHGLDAGEVWLESTEVTTLTPDARARLGLGRSFQNVRLFPGLTVRENIATAMERRIKVKSAAMAFAWAPAVRSNERSVFRRVDALIDILGLGAYRDKFVNELSTGTRRTVDIACIMASQPKMLLLDEPSSGLAQAETEELGPVLTRVAREANCGMLVIEHDVPLISSMSHRLIAMELGRVITTGPPAEVVNDPRVLTAYLSASDDVINKSDSVIAKVLDAANTPAPLKS